MTPYAAHERKKLRALWNDPRLTVAEIARAMHRGEATVWRLARELKLPARKEGKRAAPDASSIAAGPGGCIFVRRDGAPRRQGDFCPAPALPGQPYCANHMPKLGDPIPARIGTRTHDAGDTAPIGRPRGAERRASADQAAPSGQGPGCSRPPSGADGGAVAAPPSHKRESGHQSGVTVTRCPTVALLPTQARIPAETGPALAAAAQARDQAIVAAMRDKEEKGRARRLQSLAATVNARRP